MRKYALIMIIKSTYKLRGLNKQMSASREKQTRQEMNEAGVVDSKEINEMEQRQKEKRSNALYAAIAVVFLIFAVAAVVWRSNVIPKMATAATVDGEKYTAGEVSFYYNNAYMGLVNEWSYMVSYLGLDTSSPLTTQTINETAASMLGVEAGQSWHDYFLERGMTQLATVQTALKQAEAEGFVYPEGVQVQYEESVAELEAAASETYGMSLDELLKTNFGSLMTEEIYREHVLKLLQYSAYSTAYEKSLTYSDSEISAAYEADPKLYDSVTYEYVAVSGVAETTTNDDGTIVEPTEEESAAAAEEAKATAEKILSDYLAGGNLETLANANDASYGSIEGAAYSGTVLTDWLFDDSRESGDAAVVESGTSSYVMVFHDRFLEDYNTIDIRHILVQPEAATLTAEDEGYEAEVTELDAAAKARAEELYAQWKAGEATEESFAALAMAESTDSSKYVGGLYSQVPQNYMVAEFNDWCFDESRESGDTGIVGTDYGYHIMYFVGENLPFWKTLVVNDLKGTDYTEWENGLPAECNIQHGFGMKFVG